MTVITSCGNANDKKNTDENGKLSEYVEFRSVTGYYDGQKYSVDLPYLIGGEDNVLIRQENKNVDKFAEKIKNSTKDEGYMVDVSCVLIDDKWVSVRLKGSDGTSSETSSDIWATNYNVEDNTASSVLTRNFPYSENLEAWLQSYVNNLYEKPGGRKIHIYNFHAPYLYYIEDSRLMAAVIFTQLNDGGETWETIMEIDITRGPEPYFTNTEMQNIEEVIFEPDGLPSLNSVEDQINEEYSITVTYWDSDTNEYIYRLFALGQINPSFPKIFDTLNLKIIYEPGENYGGDYTKVYTFTDDRGNKNFVLKTQYWGEKDWKAGVERVCYIGVDFIDGVKTGTIRGPNSMSEEELLVLYPHDLYIAKEIIPKAHVALNMSKPSKAYIYKDPNDQSNRDLVFIVKNGQVVSVDTAESYEYSRYDRKLGLSKPVSSKNSKASELKVKTVSLYNNKFDVQEVLPDYVDADILTGNDRIITVDINIPQVAASVPGSAKINKMISGFQPYMIHVAEGLNKGDLKVLAEGDLAGYLAMNYHVYSYNNAAALVVESKGYIFHGGGGKVYLIVYYDCDTGNIMTAREYIKKCGVTEKSVLKKCAAENYVPSFPGDKVVKTIYDVKFAIDNKGNVILYSEIGD